MTSQPDKDGCFKKLGVKGHPHKLNTVATLSAVRAWVQKALVYGEAYSMWHNASGSRVKCQQLPRSHYYACFASGKPCRASGAAGIE